MLLDSHFPLSAETDDGMTALHLAAQLSHTEIAKIILEQIQKDNQYKQKNLEKIISKLNSQNNLSPLAMSILTENTEISQLLIEAGAKSYYHENSSQKDLSPIFLACEKENTNLLEMMCDQGAKLTVKNSANQTPLMFAS